MNALAPEVTPEDRVRRNVDATTSHWTILHSIAVDAAAPAALRKRASQHAAACAKLQEDRAALDEARVLFHKADPTTQTAEEMAGVRFHQTEIELLKRELELRGQLETLAADYRAALEPIFQAADTAHATIVSELRAELVKLGWLDGPEAALDPGRITPGMVLSNPRVRRAAGRVEELRAFADSTHSYSAENRRCVETVRDRLDEIKRHLARPF